MAFGDRLRRIGETVGKYGAPMIYYPTKAAVGAGRKIAGAVGGDLGIGGDGAGSMNPDFYRGDLGTPGELADRMRSGGTQQDVGVGMLGAGAIQAARMAGRGRELGEFGHDVSRISLDRSVRSRGDQLEALELQRQAAMGNAPSQAQLLLQAQADDIARRQMGAASAVRGSGQAAALRNAGMMGTQAQLQAGQQMAALRAQEMAAARGAFQAGATGIRGQDLGSAQIGTTIQGQGLGAQGQGIGLQQQAGQAIGQLGAGRESLYGGISSAERINQARNMTELEKGRMAAAAAMAGGDKALLGGMLGTAGTVVGTMYGGPAGGAAGGAVGSQLGQSVSGLQSTSQALERPQDPYEQQMVVEAGAGAAGQELLSVANNPRGLTAPSPEPAQLDDKQRRNMSKAIARRGRRAGMGGGITIL